MREALRDSRKDMLWNVILNDLQPLKQQILQYLNDIG